MPGDSESAGSFSAEVQLTHTVNTCRHLPLMQSQTGQETYHSLVRMLRKRLVRLPSINPAPDQVWLC